MPDTKFMLTNIPINRPLLKLEKVAFRYQKKCDLLLKSVDLELLPGQKVGIIGDNGSGKSTIAKLLLGLYNPEKGSVKLFGKRTNWGNHYPSLGYIGDPSYSLGGLGLPMDISVQDLIDSFKKLWANSSQEYSVEFEKQLAIKEFYTTDVAELSKGQRMRVMAFLALAKQPKLLIADEATEGLDEDSREAVLSAIQQACSRSDFGMLLISHRYYEVALLTDTVYKLYDGQLICSSINGLNCEIEINSKTNTDLYPNLEKNEALEIVSKVFINPQVSSFKFTGKKQV